MKKRVLSLTSILFITAALVGCTTTDKTGNENVFEPINQGSSESSESGSGAIADSQASLEKDIALTTYHYFSKKDDVERCTGKYIDITFSDEIRQKYPKLAASIDETTTNWETIVSQDVGEYAYWYDETYDSDMTFYMEKDVEIVRFDDRLFSMLEYEESFTGGAHPNHSCLAYNLDPATGKSYALKDVLLKPDDFPATIRDKMGKMSPELLEEIDSFHYDEGDVFEDKLKYDSYSFTIDEKGLHIIFSPYEVASYAAGTIEVDFTYEEYPDLVTDIFKMSAPADMDSRITRTDGGTTEMEAKEYYETEEFDGENPERSGFEVTNPDWAYYFNDTYKNDKERHYLALTQTKEEVTDWLDTDVWAKSHGFTVPQFPYADETYHYEAYDSLMFDYMYNSILITTVNGGETIIDYDLSKICNGPDEKEYKITAQTEYIRYAKIVDDTLYVEVSHWGYATEEPDNAYIVAIDLNTNEVIFRTEPLVANANNFQIVDDTIICGYGFTSEPDYIYLLDRYTGKTVQQIPVKSAPYQFEIVGDTLYVATYNTAYEFKIA